MVIVVFWWIFHFASLATVEMLGRVFGIGFDWVESLPNLVRVGLNPPTVLTLIGFILLDLAHFGFPELTKVAGYELMLCAASALYMMAHVIYGQVFGYNVLPVGKPWLKPKKQQ